MPILVRPSRSDLVRRRFELRLQRIQALPAGSLGIIRPMCLSPQVEARRSAHVARVRADIAAVVYCSVHDRGVALHDEIAVVSPVHKATVLVLRSEGEELLGQLLVVLERHAVDVVGKRSAEKHLATGVGRLLLPYLAPVELPELCSTSRRPLPFDVERT
jgi:hypothetical protein